MHTEVLTEEGKQLFPLFKNFSDFYLAGGTALALQLGHRVSVDFDFFYGEKIPKKLLTEAEAVFLGKSTQILVNNSDELTLMVDGVKVTFLAYPFPVLLPLVEEENMRMLSAKEIGVTKAYTLGRRGELKDYIDIYFLLKEQVTTLEELSGLAGKKYEEAFDRRLFFEQLVYLDDVEDTAIQFLRETVAKDELKIFFENEVKRSGI